MAVSACPRVCPSIQFIVLVRVLVIVLDPVISSTSITITRTSTASLSTISELPGKHAAAPSSKLHHQAVARHFDLDLAAAVEHFPPEMRQDHPLGAEARALLDQSGIIEMHRQAGLEETTLADE